MPMTEIQEPDNARLIRAMKMAARIRDDATRKKLYHAIISSKLWLAVSVPWSVTEPLATEDLESAGDLQGRPSAAVFTCREYALKWREDHEQFVLVDATDLFSALIKTRIGSVQINPAGPTGGELYRHEVETIAEGGRILRLRAQAADAVH